jgi:aspartyl-tRNA(Asn)/glutamyl-tRNA(Gln) amidotransferase subunit A
VSGLPDGRLESALDMQRALRAGFVSAVELADRAIRLAEAWQPAINAFSQLWADQTLEEARRVDSTAAERRGSAGVPVAVKDLFDVVGRETTGCSRAFEGNVAGADCPVVSRVRSAGLVMMGKTNQHELAAGGTNLVSGCGRTANPWDTSRMTGGSSGGSAAAVAAGIVPWALGSDTGGSIRIPSSMCGTFGLKPTTGRLPIEGVMPLAPSMDCPGPIAATLGDLEALFGCMDGSVAGSDPRAASSSAGRVALCEGFFGDVVHPEVAAAVEGVAAALSRAGTEIAPVDGSGIEDARDVWSVICCFEFSRAYEHVRDRRPLMAPRVVRWLERGDRVTPAELAEADRRREEIRQWYRERLNGVDALLIPTCAYPAPRADATEVSLGDGRVLDVEQVGPGYITCSVNLADMPALNLPAGRSSDGLPIGVSLVARPGDEWLLFELGRRWSDAVGYRPRRPTMPV